VPAIPCKHSPDKALEARIDYVGKAQEPDGYLSTCVQDEFYSVYWAVFTPQTWAQQQNVPGI